jgi:CrcB protein
MEYRAALLVAAGGFAGAVSRHGIAVALPESFPWGTLAVNVCGAFLLGLLVYAARTGDHIPETTRLFVSTGAISSFTTYSTFAVETASLGSTLAVVNVVANYTLGLGAVFVARGVVRWRS